MEGADMKKPKAGKTKAGKTKAGKTKTRGREKEFERKRLVVAAILKDNASDDPFALKNIKSLGLDKGDEAVTEAAGLIKDVVTLDYDPYVYFSEYIKEFDDGGVECEA